MSPGKKKIGFQCHKDSDSPNLSNVSVPGLLLNYLWQGLFSVCSQSVNGRSCFVDVVNGREEETPAQGAAPSPGDTGT